jgi:hypothetical protein
MNRSWPGREKRGVNSKKKGQQSPGGSREPARVLLKEFRWLEGEAGAGYLKT